MAPIEAPPMRAMIERAQLPRRRAKRNQRLPTARRVTPMEVSASRPPSSPLVLTIIEKLPLLALAAVSAIITPYAQGHGGSMASTNDLSFAFRVENALQSYLTYITRMFYPGRMSVLYLLDVDKVNHYYTALSIIVLTTITGLVILGLVFGRRYLAFGWAWYLGTLVPVIGIMQVGEQTHADRYTYTPYIGLFIMLAWAWPIWLGCCIARGGCCKRRWGLSWWRRLPCAWAGPSSSCNTGPAWRSICGMR